MSLYSGKRLHSYIWEELLIDDDVIERVEHLASKENQPLHLDNHPLFEWPPGKPVEDSDTIEFRNENELIALNVLGSDEALFENQHLEPIPDDEVPQRDDTTAYIMDIETLDPELEESDDASIENLMKNFE